MSTPAIRKLIEEHGGTVQDTHDGIAVSFDDTAEPERPRADAKDIEAAVARAREFGTTFVRLYRDRGDGWYAASSHEQHPGFSYLCQIDYLTGQPIRCECAASVICHHLGAAVADWREQVGYEANGAEALEGWKETLRMVREGIPQVQEEEWV